MPSSIINSDNGVSSGTTGLKTTGGDDGILKIQTNGTDAVTVSTGQVVSLANALPVASGGTGAATLTANNVILGNGTSAVQFVAAGTNGNVLTSNGTTWTSAPISAGGDYVMTVFTSPGTWTKPAGLKAVKVTVIGAGGNGGAGSSGVAGGNGGGGGGSIEYLDAPAIPGPVAVTVGTAPSKTSSFGAFLSATGGGNGSAASGCTPGSAGGGGAGSGGDINISGEAGFAFGNSSSGRGGAAAFGMGVGISGDYPGGTAGYLYGGGAIGKLNSGSGGTGAAGIVIVEEFY